MKSAHILDALTMCVLNLVATCVLTTLHFVNALYQWANAFVMVAAPLAAAVFFVLTVIWLLELTRRTRRWPAFVSRWPLIGPSKRPGFASSQHASARSGRVSPVLSRKVPACFNSNAPPPTWY